MATFLAAPSSQDLFFEGISSISTTKVQASLVFSTFDSLLTPESKEEISTLLLFSSLYLISLYNYTQARARAHTRTHTYPRPF